ncbi:MAG: RloB family protein [Arcobacteraceae bacterium]|nr:RloB family protein [Arcobacteraceae bacterium]
MAKRGGDKIFQRQKKELKKQDFERQKEIKSKIPDIIIACEDEVSAPTYFQMIVKKLINSKLITQDSFVIANHNHNNPTGVLKDLTNHKCDNGKTYKNFEHKWIVIDRDIERVNGGGHNKEDFNNALSNAKRLQVDVAYCNDSFELWYLLHFDYRDTGIFRDEILKEVIKKLKAKDTHKFTNLDTQTIKQANYTKLLFEELLELQPTAIHNSKKLLSSYGTTHNPQIDNPSTTVHLLVEVLNCLNK